MGEKYSEVTAECVKLTLCSVVKLYKHKTDKYATNY